MVAAAASHPTARVEYALRADDLLNEPQVRQVMEYYLALRMRRLDQTARSFGPIQPTLSAQLVLGPGAPF